MTETISLLLPSRGRPESLHRMIHSARSLADEPTAIETVVRLDEDDPRLNEYNQAEITTTLVGPRDVLSRNWNECYEHATGEILMHCGDDIIFRTRGWDTTVRSTFESVPDRILLVHGNDGLQPETFGTHSFLHRRWVEAVGYFVPPYFVSDYNDTWLNEVANMIGRRRYIPIYTEHMHFVNGKGPLDQTHLERLERHRKEDPGTLYATLLPERREDARKLSEVIGRSAPEVAQTVPHAWG